MDFEKAKAFLQRKEGSTSVYEHLTEILLKLITEQPTNALDTFETICAKVKGATFPSLSNDNSPESCAAPELDEAKDAHLTQASALFKPIAEAYPDNCQNLTQDAALLEWGGIGMSRTDMYRLHLSMKHFASTMTDRNLRNIRFWGRIFGRKGDYIIIEGVADPVETDETPEEKDAKGNTIEVGTGANYYTYWYCRSIGGPWTELPPVTPHQIIVARKIRRFLTGDPENIPYGHPPFPGKELNLLRAQIALISADTVLAPNGAYEVEDDDTGVLTRSEEPLEELPRDLSEWVHVGLELNEIGRTKQENTEDEEAEPPVTLRPASDDPPVGSTAPPGTPGEEEEQAAWELRNLPSLGITESKEDANGAVVLVSRKWPGAVAVGLGTSFANAYVGWGIPFAPKPYQPALPADLPTEYTVINEEEGEDAETKLVTEQPDVTEPPAADEEEEEYD